jgi:dihydroxyacetone kinase-like protein
MSAQHYFDRLFEVFETEAAHLNGLDAAIGDGDHGSTMLRGLAAARKAEPGVQARAFMRASGGASGTLFGLVLIEIESFLAGSGRSLESHLGRALERVRELGQAEPGDKSMVDALSPAVSALHAGGSLGEALAAATAGCESTRDMKALRGRARYVENAGVGHIDPGATSVCLMLSLLPEEPLT